MGPPRRKLLATVEETTTPPDSLSDSQIIARVVKAAGNNLYQVSLPRGRGQDDSVLVEMPAKFRSTIWLKRGGYVVIDSKPQSERDNKIAGEIVNVCRDEKLWRKQPYWPKEFDKRQPIATSPSDDDGDEDEEEESNMGKMPPSDDDDE